MQKLLDDNTFNREQIQLHQRASNIHAEIERITSYHDKEHMPTLRYEKRIAQLNDDLTGLKDEFARLSYHTLLNTIQPHNTQF